MELHYLNIAFVLGSVSLRAISKKKNRTATTIGSVGWTRMFQSKWELFFAYWSIHELATSPNNAFHNTNQLPTELKQKSIQITYHNSEIINSLSFQELHVTVSTYIFWYDVYKIRLVASVLTRAMCYRSENGDRGLD